LFVQFVEDGKLCEWFAPQVNRLEALVTRYKASSEELEKSEEELKGEKRKLQREVRNGQNVDLCR